MISEKDGAMAINVNPKSADKLSILVRGIVYEHKME
jgi:hypothetical protein